MAKKAKLFNNGGSQAVRLPAEFRFQGEEVFIWRDEHTGEVVLSLQPRGSWTDFVSLRNRLQAVPEDFLSNRGQPSETRDPIGGAQ